MASQLFRNGVTGLLVQVSLLGLAITSNARGQPATTPPSQGLPEEKRTTLGLYVTAQEAYAKWKAAPGTVRILDVRTLEEFLFVGHPAMAWNIPLFYQTYEWDAGKGRFPMTPNPEFVSLVNKIARPGDTILVMCRSGGRSAMAVNELAKAGFNHVYNITDGMEGDAVQDPGSVYLGQRMRNGWKNSQLPWTYDIAPERVLLPKPARREP